MRLLQSHRFRLLIAGMLVLGIFLVVFIVFWQCADSFYQFISRELVQLLFHAESRLLTGK